MTRPLYLGLLGGTAFLGISLGRWMRPAAVEPAATPPVIAAAVKVERVDASKVEGRDWFGQIKAASTTAEFSELWARIDRCHLPYAYVELLQEWLMGRWITKDLEGCLAKCNSVPNVIKKGVPWIGDALAAWAKVDIPSALAKAQKIDAVYPPDLRLQVEALSRRIAELDPVGFLENKYRLSKELHREGMEQALTTVARRSPQEAITLSQRYAFGKTNGSSLGFTAQVIADSAANQMGVGAALEWTRSLADLPKEDRKSLETSLLNSLAATNPSQALAEASGWDWAKQGALPSELWSLLAKQNPAQAWQLASKHEPYALPTLAAALAPDATTLTRNLSSLRTPAADENEISADKLAATLQALPATHCLELLNQAGTLPEGAERKEIQTAAWQAWAKQEPDAAMARVFALADATERQQSALAIIKSIDPLLMNDPSNVSSCLKLIDAALPKELSESTEVDSTGELLSKISRTAPDAVFKWLEAQPDPFRYNAWMPRVLEEMTKRQPEQAVTLALQLSSPELRQSAISNTIGQWTTYDPHAASVWAKTLPPGPERATAALGLAQGIASVEPELALPWALESTPGDSRRDAICRVLQQWEKDDPGAVSKALQRIQADEALQQDIEFAWQEVMK